MFKKLKQFLKEAKQEIKKVNWPTKKETVRYTMFVIGISLAIAVYLGLLDYVFTNVLKFII
jgi:preprotein translocase subunit SecE